MSDTGWIIAGQGRDVDRSANTDWTNPGNVTADDGTNATNALTSGGSDWLVADTFDLSSIPSDATITGIEVRIQASSTVPFVFGSNFGQINIGKDDSTLGTERTADSSISFFYQSTTAANYDFGGPFDLWGLTLSVADVQASTFQARCWFDDNDPFGTPTVSVDAVWIRVHYTVPRETVIFLTTTGQNTWTVPNDWNSLNNSIECIGAGGSCVGANDGRGGGGGGAYSKISNLVLDPGDSIDYRVGSPSSTDTTRQTWFSSTSTVLAKGGAPHGGASNRTGGQGGQASSGVGDVTYSGGDGGDGVGGNNGNAGGGGAAGPHGDGADGGDTPGGDGTWGGGGGGAADGGFSGSDGPANDGGAGGANRQGAGAGAPDSGAGSQGGGGAGGDDGPPNASGGAGSAETLWTQTSDSATAGPGSGGGGAGGNSGSGGQGHTYGGGAGCPQNNGTTAAGGNGLIVVTYMSNGAKTRSYILG
jgi:hypothetical protein